MRNEIWTSEQNNEATRKAYEIAVRDGAVNLAHNIVAANPQIDWAAVDANLKIKALVASENVLADNLEAPETV